MHIFPSMVLIHHFYHNPISSSTRLYSHDVVLIYCSWSRTYLFNPYESMCYLHDLHILHLSSMSLFCHRFWPEFHALIPSHFLRPPTLCPSYSWPDLSLCLSLIPSSVPVYSFPRTPTLSLLLGPHFVPFWDSLAYSILIFFEFPFPRSLAFPFSRFLITPPLLGLGNTFS